jgi:hypothetical protein
MLGMERIDAASLAYQSGVHRGNPASAISSVSLNYRVADWGVTLVRRTHSAGLPLAPTALAGARRVDWI